MQQSIKASPDALASARESGRAEALAADRRLRDEERRERRLRLAELDALGFEVARPLSSHERDELQRLAGFVRAVQDSRGWQALQALRRLVGRAW
jgi:hypothetical protein